ncbi:hypothetical protein NP233_g2246 [Leucocoprinus birnbaumii]|uniref:Uncharacterized protein n=1 Tax=Leucocoprinus birnbaumii TaxID=56174 RepID=A0AAD5VZ73_9AGAR|nr:hypothetical protein NP233_g2246 [Leucocoprinus birnbaumii]
MDNTTLPNPDTLLNHLPPADATQFELAKNISIALLGVGAIPYIIGHRLTINPDEDCNLGPVDLPPRGQQDNNWPVWSRHTLLFVFSVRQYPSQLCLVQLYLIPATISLIAMAYTLLSVIFESQGFSSCRGINIALDSTCITSMTCTSYLFLRRLQAVYFDKPVVRWLFNFLWLASVAVSVLNPLGLAPAHIPGTSYCTVHQIHGRDWTAASRFVPAAFDSLVFLAISCKMVMDHVWRDAEGVRSWHAFFTGNLPPLSRALLRGGQQYYLFVFVSTIASGIVLDSPSVPLIYGPALTLLSVVLSASMACRVYRNLKTLDLTVQGFPNDIPVISNIQFRNGTKSRESAGHPNPSPSARIMTVIESSSTSSPHASIV